MFKRLVRVPEEKVVRKRRKKNVVSNDNSKQFISSRN